MIRLCAVGFAAYCSYAICRTPLLPLYARALGAAPEQIGLVMAASTITGAILKLPAGVWSDILGRGPLLLLAATIFAVTPFAYFAVAGLGALIAIRFVHGSATAIMGPVMSATISDAAPVARRATWLSTYSTIQGTGQALAPILAGALIARGRYDLAFLIAGTIGVLALLMATRVTHLTSFTRITRITSFTRITRFTRLTRDGVADVLSERRILVASLAYAAYYATNGALTAFLPLFAHDRIGMTPIQIGWLFGLQTLTTLAIRPLVGAASDRLGRRGAIVTGLVTCAAGVMAVSVARAAAGVYLAVLIYAAGVAITTAATTAYITDVAPRARFGAAHGVFGTIYDIGDAAGPLVGGVLVTTFGYEWTFQALAALAVTTAALFAWQSRALQPAA